MSNKVVLNGNRILVKQSEAEGVSAGGLIIPDSAKQKPSRGVVFSAGEKCSFVKEGDKVLFSKDTGMPMSFDGEEYLIMTEPEIMLKYE